MGEGRDHQKYEDAPLFRCVITTVYEPHPHNPPQFRLEGGTEVVIKGPYNTPSPAWTAHGKALQDHVRYPRKGVMSVKARVDVGTTMWGELTR